MILKLVREVFTDKSTIGRLYVNGAYQCYILEDKDRGLEQSMKLEDIQKLKVYGVTAIPYGTYNVTITYSNHFKKELPLLNNVPGFEGIRIHSGNTDADSLGCLITGNTRNKDFVGESKIAFDKLFPIIKTALDKKEQVSIIIEKIK